MILPKFKSFWAKRKSRKLRERVARGDHLKPPNKLQKLKIFLTQRKLIKRLKEHCAVAQGSDRERLFIAAAMCELENEMVQKECGKLPADQQKIFLMTYECFLMWSLKFGFEKVLNPEDTKSAVVALQKHFARHACYEPETFEKIWAKMQETMPSAMIPKGDLGVAWPVFEMTQAATLAGFELTPPLDYRFGCHIIFTMNHFGETGRNFA
jgi:hypothetical protein